MPCRTSSGRVRLLATPATALMVVTAAAAAAGPNHRTAAAVCSWLDVPWHLQSVEGGHWPACSAVARQQRCSFVAAVAVGVQQGSAAATWAQGCEYCIGPGWG